MDSPQNTSNKGRGGSPLPYARQWIDEHDVDAVVNTLRSDWLTTGPMVDEFEQQFSTFVGAQCAIALCNGTAALHAAMFAIGISPGDEVILPALTFVATANSVVYQGGTPIIVDVCPDTLLIDPREVERNITRRTKAVISVDYAGQPCDYEALRALAAQHGLALVADACHALGGAYKGRPVGSLADMSTFSFHPAKHITTAEGGMVTTNDTVYAEKIRTFRNHGITTEHWQRATQGTWFYEMVELGYNYRLSDLHCALGSSQLKKVPTWVARRREIAQAYDVAFSEIPGISPVAVASNVTHAYHLYVVRLDCEALRMTRAEVFEALRARGIGVNVHYIPVHLHPFYRERFGTTRGQCPNAEQAYEEILSVPMYPAMTDSDVRRVVNEVAAICG